MKSAWNAGVLVCVLALAGCGKKSEQTAASAGSGSAGSGSDMSGSGSASAAGSGAAACDLAGAYRVRYASNGKEGWWFRFTVTGDKATLDEEASVLALEPGPLDLKLDTAKCTLTLGMKSRAVEDATMVLTLDPKTHAVTGTFDRKKATDDKEKSTKVAGVHDGTTPPKGPACVTRGIYKIEIAKAAKWKNSDASDDRPCEDPWIAVNFLAEPFGDTVAVSLREFDAPYKEQWGDDKVTKTGECTADVDLQGEGFKLTAKLTFAADKITGTASLADQQIVEDGDEGENIWNCLAKDAPLEITRIDNAPPKK